MRDVSAIPECKTLADFEREHAVSTSENIAHCAVLFFVAGAIATGIALYRPYFKVASAVPSEVIDFGVLHMCRNGNCTFYDYFSDMRVGRCLVSESDVQDRFALMHGAGGGGDLFCLFSLMAAFFVACDVRRLFVLTCGVFFGWVGIMFASGAGYVANDTFTSFLFCGNDFCSVVGASPCTSGVGDTMFIYFIGSIGTILIGVVILTALRVHLFRVHSAQRRVRKEAEVARVDRLVELRLQREDAERQAAERAKARERKRRAARKVQVVEPPPAKR